MISNQFLKQFMNDGGIKHLITRIYYFYKNL